MDLWITDPLFNSTEKTGSAPPGGLNDTVRLTRTRTPPHCALPYHLWYQFCRVWFIIEMTWQFGITAAIQCQYQQPSFPDCLLIQPPGLMLLRVSAYWGSEYRCLKKALILTYTLCTMGTASLQVLAVSKIYRTRGSRSPITRS